MNDTTTDLAALRAENERLKAEVSRLSAEVDREHVRHLATEDLRLAAVKRAEELAALLGTKP